jgi:hypothetical protein
MADASVSIFLSVLKHKTVLLWLIAILLGFYFIFYVIKNAERESHGFATYYTASRLLIEGAEVSQFYNDDYFSANVKRFVPEVYEIYLVNLPTTAIMLLPVASFNYKTARVIWTIFNLIVLIITLIFLLKQLQLRQHWIPAALILFLTFQPLYANFAYGQAYVIIFLLLTVAWYAYTSEKHFLLGMAIGLMIILKSAGILLPLLLLVQRKWKSFSWSFASVFILVIISVPFIGFDAWEVYLQKLIIYSSAPELSVTAYQTVHSFFHHLMVFDQKWNPEPLFDATLMGSMLSLMVSLFILILISAFAYKVKIPELSFGVFVIAGMIISPVSLDYHYLIMIIPLLIYFYLQKQDKVKVKWFMYFIFLVMMAAPVPYTSAVVAGGWLSLLAYPKFYGSVGLLGLYLLSLFKSNLNKNNLSLEKF